MALEGKEKVEVWDWNKMEKIGTNISKGITGNFSPLGNFLLQTFRLKISIARAISQ